jgi:drug/metabolite transporter (DMT)-like permease
MHQSLVYAIGSACGYALFSVMLEKRFSDTNALTIMIVGFGIPLTITVIARTILNDGGSSFAWPRGPNLLILCMGGVLFFFADYWYVQATQIGKAYVVNLVMVLMPVIALILTQCWERTVPNRFEMASYCFAMLALASILYGSMRQP